MKSQVAHFSRPKMAHFKKTVDNNTKINELTAIDWIQKANAYTGGNCKSQN